MLMLVGCAQSTEKERTYILEGAWTLRHVKYPMGSEDDFSLEGDGTFCNIYDRDSMLYECRLAATPSGLVVVPASRCTITLIDKGGGELLYLEGNNPRPLTVSSDSTIVIQRQGTLFTYVRTDDIYHEWGDEIRSIFADDLKDKHVGGDNRYVLSAKEREQASVIHWLEYAVIAFVILVLTITLIAVGSHRAKQRLLLQLQQIKDEHDERPQSVRQAMMAEEDRFFASEEYAALQKRISSGQLLKEEEWSNIEAQTKKAYPGFATQLRSLYPLSELEYQTCLLIKLRIAPTDIAAVLARDVSTISTVRSRLYKKVFGRKGGAKDWDEFVLSIGA